MNTPSELNDSEKRILASILSGMTLALKLEKGFFDDHLTVRIELMHEEVVISSVEESIYLN